MMKADTANSAQTAASSSLVPAFGHQDQQFSRAFSLLDEALAARVFSASSVAVTHRNHLVLLKAVGRLTFDLETSPVTVNTVFDLASVTKVVATTAVAMLLYERGRFDLETPVANVVPEFLQSATGGYDPRRARVTFRMLLAHSSGLPAYEKLFLQVQARGELLHAAFTMPLADDPGSRAEYSDIGFIILGAALERMAGEPLDHVCQREVFAPLGMSNTTFNPPPEVRATIPATQNDVGFRKRIIQGEVQDENASVLGGVAGHAGLFSTAEDLARFAHVMLHGGHPILQPETVTRFCQRESAPAGTSRALGWDTPSASSQSGKYFSSGSFGHLGYAGTSLWIDPTRQVSITLLTNRTWPDCSNQKIREVRPAFHDAVMEDLEGVAPDSRDCRGEIY